MLKDHFRRHVCLVLAKRRDDGKVSQVILVLTEQDESDYCIHPCSCPTFCSSLQIVAGTFNVVKAGRFYGRYWGCFEEVKNLHFETCYYKSIEYCINEGLKTMEPGAGGDSFKYMRGFDPAEINSMHYIVHPGLRTAVEDFLDFERRQVSHDSYSGLT